MKNSLPSLLKSIPQREVRKHSRILATITVWPAGFLSLFSLAFFYLNKYQITHVHLRLTAISYRICTLGRIGQIRGAND